jgi:hypothetical protein
VFPLSTGFLAVLIGGLGFTGHGSAGSELVESLALAALFVGMSATGALIVSTDSRNPIGWILCACPLIAAVTVVAGDYYAEAATSPDFSTETVVFWLANWLWVPGIIPLFTLLFLLFPDGRPPSARWRPVIWLSAGAAFAAVFGYALSPGPLEDYPRIANPLALPGIGGDIAVLLRDLALPLLGVAAVASTASLALRFRRAHGEERLQVKWVAAAGALFVASWASSIAIQALTGLVLNGLLVSAGLAAVVGAIAVAVLRYRLYDIDVVINRTLVYGGLTATLIVAYLGMVLMLELALSPLTGQSDLAIAGSTLAAAALFRPARRRIQSLVDRRFYRRRYDAARTLESFGARLRDEVELSSLEAELRRIVAQTMQPAHVSVWLREAA